MARRRSARLTMPFSARIIPVLTFLLFCSAAPAPVRAQAGHVGPWHIHPTAHFDIYYQAPQRSHLQAVAMEAELAYARIGVDLRHDLAEKMPLILVRQDRDLPRNVEEARELVTASGASERDHLLLSAETFAQRPSVVAHELTHQFLFELLPASAIDMPWVSEGVSDHQSATWDAVDLVKVRDALVLGRLPAVESLTASDRHWGHAVFDFVAAEYGAHGVRQYLSALRSGLTRSTADIIRVVFGVSASDFDRAFHRYVRSRFEHVPRA
jgi:hypothetical protein